MVSVLALAPLLLALVVVLAAAFWAIRKKATAQAYCVSQGVRLQLELKSTLEQLLRLNRPAKALRARRSATEKALAAAILSGNPAAIATARAARTAVIAEQMALSTRQTALLREAARLRLEAHRELSSRVSPLGVRSVEARSPYWRALAVEPRPLNSPTPDYVPVPGFTQWQQQTFRFAVDLQPPLPTLERLAGARQITECAISLTGKESQWSVRILATAASAASKWR